MSVEKVNMFTVICDNCGEDIGVNQEYSCFGDDSCAEENAMESDWIKQNGNHYCTECYSYNDDDELVIDEKRKATISKHVDSGVELIAKERQKQIDKYGFTGEHHADHPEWYEEGQLLSAASVLLKNDLSGNVYFPLNWNPHWFYNLCRRKHKERIVIAGALIAAEIDRLQRIK